MARGQAAIDQLKTTNAAAANEGAQAQGLQKQLTPGYTSLMDTGYFNPQEEASAGTSEMGAATAPFGAANFEAANRASRTNNPADLTSQQDQLALSQGRTAGTAASNLQDQKMKGQMYGMGGLSDLNSEDMKAMESMYGLGPSTLDARANLENASWGWAKNILDPLLQAGGQVGAAALKP